MDTSGNIRRLALAENPRENEMLLSDEQARELSHRSAKKRKNWMRNQPCTCGSGKKFKKCCWSKVARSGSGFDAQLVRRPYASR
jgi:hypothetical protein